MTVRHKRKLEQIREEHNGRGSSGGGHSSTGIEEDGTSIGAGEGDVSSPVRTIQGTESSAGIDGGFGSGNGSSNNETGDDYSSAGETGSIATPQPAIDLDAERERKRELARQRKARQRDRELNDKQSNPSLKVVRDSDLRDDTTFNLKSRQNKTAEEVKVFSQKEADESLQKLIFVYQRGSEILDDILEIVVKGHEKVQIWTLSEDEAVMFATMQMEKAKKDKVAARTVRTLINIYDRMYLFMIVGPRVIATGQHVKAHGGLSFK